MAAMEGRNKPKLSEIKLPEFNGEYTKEFFFKNSFEITIHNDEDQVHTSINISSEYYEQAQQLLKDTYDKIMIINTHLEELFNFPNISKDDKADFVQ